MLINLGVNENFAPANHTYSNSYNAIIVSSYVESFSLKLRVFSVCIAALSKHFKKGI